MKKTLGLILSILVFFSIAWCFNFTAYAWEETSEYHYGELGDGTVEIARYLGSAKKVVIPSEINGKKVSKISADAFYGHRNLENVTIPESVVSIGMGAFDDTALYNNKANWTDGVLYISNYLIDANPKKIQGSYTIKKGTKCIAESAFESCTKLTKVVIPDSVVTIGDLAFAECTKLKSIKLSKNLKLMGAYAFEKTAFSKNTKNWTNESLYLSNYLIEVDKKVKGTYKVKEGTIGIIGQAFAENKNISKVIIPDSVENLDEAIFYNCSKLKEVKLPKNLKYIPSDTFSECTSLKSISIPKSVTKIGQGAFNGCESLKEIKLPANIDYIADFAFDGCTSLKSLTIPDKVTCFKGCFDVCENLLSITIPTSVKIIDAYTFDYQECPKLTRINYRGTVAQWKQIKIGSYNGGLKNLVVYCKDGNILPIKSTKIKSIQVDFKSMKITWEKVTNAKDYQVQIATDVNFIKNKKNYTVKGTSTTIKNLKSRQKYYVRVRSQRGKIYTNWTKVKIVTTR